MKVLLPLLFALTACTTVGTKEALDSTEIEEIKSIPDSLVEEESVTDDPELNKPADTSQLGIRYNEVSQANELHTANYYRVNIVTSQYEASSEVIWYFDDSFDPHFFVMSWSSEGNEGITSFFIENDEVICAKEEDNFSIDQWCSTTGGIRTRYNEEGDIVEKELLPNAYAGDMNNSLKYYLDILKSLLKEGERTEQDENTYAVRIEKTVNYGQEYTESTEVTIPKKVYDAIVN